MKILRRILGGLIVLSFVAAGLYFCWPVVAIMGGGFAMTALFLFGCYLLAGAWDEA